ncbi:MAG: TonB-dependent receptor, partial [Burkholderiaceae bacterium]
MNINRLRSSVRRGARRGFWLGALCWAWGVQAQPAQVVQLPEVVVTATRVNTPLEDVVRDVTVLGREEIEASGASTLVELLGRLPGVVGVGDARLYIRGAEARMTAVYVDGVRVDRQDALTPGGGAPWDVLPLDDVERIEVLRGTASSLYGSDGMGGVVLISTASEDQSTRATLGLGSSQGRLVGLKLKRASGEIRASLALASEQNDGYDERPDLVHSPANLPQQSSQASGAIHFGQRDTGGEVTLGFRRGWDRRTSVDNNWDGTGSNY